MPPHEEILGQPPAPALDPGSRSLTVSDSAETPERTSPVLESSDTPMSPVANQSDADGISPTVSLLVESLCDESSILRNEPTDEPADLENQEHVNAAGLAASVESRGQETLGEAEDNPLIGAKNVIEPANANHGNPQGDERKARRAAVLPEAVAFGPSACAHGHEALDRLTDAERKRGDGRCTQ